MKRDDLLSRAFIGAPLELAGREIRLSSARYSLLKYWKNSLFNDHSEQDKIDGRGEAILLAWSTKEEVRQLQRMTNEERAKAVTEFMLEYEDELPGIYDALDDKADELKAADVESELPGKEEPAHVS